MVEAGADEVSEEKMLEAILFGHEEIKAIIAVQEDIIAQVGKEKMDVVLATVNQDIEAQVRALSEGKLKDAVLVKEKHEREAALKVVEADILEQYEDEELHGDVKEILHKLTKEEFRRLITKEKIRPDGRGPEEIRPLASEVQLLPRTHGSGLFTRGQTQAMSVCTLGALGEVQIIDGLGQEESKRFMHHYNFPQFSVGETGPIRAPGRREIGHGALGERALERVIPDEQSFPYTIRLVSEVLESNGSTSQASICASTLAMMDAGVPIKAPVAGIAMGLVKEDDYVTVLTDIQGMEDALGDMDFKVAGTGEGITALQMDMKISGINRDILVEALEQARKARLHILNSMLDVIQTSRPELSAYAPKIMTMSIKPDKIRDVIGPSGKVINQIIEDTGVKIDIEQDGTVYISSTDATENEAAKRLIEDIVREVEVGEIYNGKVKRIEKFGAFVELFKGKDGLVHISQLAKERVNKVEDIVKIGDRLEVKVTEIDNQGRVNLSHKVLLKDEEKEETKEKPVENKSE